MDGTDDGPVRAHGQRGRMSSEALKSADRGRPLLQTAVPGLELGSPSTAPVLGPRVSGLGEATRVPFVNVKQPCWCRFLFFQARVGPSSSDGPAVRGRIGGFVEEGAFQGRQAGRPNSTVLRP